MCDSSLQHSETMQHDDLFICDWSLQLAATRCYTLQHTVPHGNTMHHTAPNCTTLHRTAPHRNTLQHNATQCHTLQVKAWCHNCYIVEVYFMSLSLVRDYPLEALRMTPDGYHWGYVYVACCSVLQLQYVAVCCSFSCDS